MHATCTDTHTHTHIHTHAQTHTPPRHVLGLLASAREKVVFGGVADDDERYISPTLLTNVMGEDDIMKEEIFGPILPFVTVESVDKAIEFVNSR